MPIPNNIRREHIFQALLNINRYGVPPRQEIRRWALIYEGIYYPVKYVVSIANLYANGVELDPRPNNFTSNSAKDFLQYRGFTIQSLQAN